MVLPLLSGSMALTRNTIDPGLALSDTATRYSDSLNSGQTSSTFVSRNITSTVVVRPMLFLATALNLYLRVLVS